MKRLHFYYEINLFMSQDVTDHHFQIKCVPMESSSLHCLEISCQTEPEVLLTRVEDGFGNKGFYGVINEKHSQLTIKAEGLVERSLLNSLVPLPAMYKFPSSLTKPGENILSFYGKLENKLKDFSVFDGAVYIMNSLYDSFIYESGSTNVKTTAEEALAGGKGVCQDYSHILISLFRTAKIPARYVAGLMMGEGATHAWVEAWIDGKWMGFDPTNNVLVGEDYIKLTHGRDFNDGALDKGHFTGIARQSQKIYVKVEEVIDQGKS